MVLGSPAGTAESTSSLPYFRLFRPSAAIVNSVELHMDGTVYVSYTPPRAPEWYVVGRADDAEDTRDRAIHTGRRMRRFSDVQAANAADTTWLPPERAFPPGRGPAPRWVALRLSSVDSCASDRARLTRLRGGEARASRGIAARVVEWIRQRELARLAHRLASVRCRPNPAPDWTALLSSPPAHQTDVLASVPGATTPLVNSGDYCSRDVVSKLDPLLGIFDPNVGPPEWTTILPRNWALPQPGESGPREPDNGQRKYRPTLPLRWPGNHYVTWPEVARLAQTDTARLRTVLKWHDRPSHRDVRDRPIPWIASAVGGVVANSFLSGADYAGDHTEPPADYWLGVTPPPDSEPCGLFNAEHSLCDDWIVLTRLDPEYRFLLAQDREREAGTDKGLGNFTAELGGSLEAEIEQWLIPIGYRPEPADRISMTGRWVVDCGHDDWHTELHPIESFVAAHVADSAIDASVVVTGDWPGGELELDVWPPARPSASGVLRWRRHGRVALAGLTVDERPEPADNPNHLRLTVVSTTPWQPLVTEDWNQVQPHPTRRLVAKYRLWWSER